MAEKNFKPGWKIWRFDQMVTNVNVRIDNPSESGMEHYVGLEHLDSDSLRIRRWGSPDDVEATKLCFKKGDIIFARRRAYQRKLGIAEFDGICSAHAMVVRAKPEVVLPEFLPFFMQSDLFMNRAVEISVGSLSPTINWKTMAVQEFELPTIDEQKHIADLLSEIDASIARYEDAEIAAIKAKKSFVSTQFKVSSAGNERRMVPASALCVAPITKGATPTTQLSSDSSQIPFLKIYNLTQSGSVDFTIDPTFVSVAAHQSELGRSKVISGDILMSIAGTMGRVSVVPVDFGEANINQAIARFRLNDPLLRDFFFAYLTSDIAQQWLVSRAKKTAQMNLTLQLCQDLPVPVFNSEEMQRILTPLRLIDSGLDSVINRLKQIKSLKRGIRNAILESEYV